MDSHPLGFQIEGKTFDFSFEGHGEGGFVRVVERAQKKIRRVRLSSAIAKWIADVVSSKVPEVGFVSKKRFGRALALIKARSNAKGPFLEIGVALRGRFEAIFVPHGRRDENWKEMGRFLSKSISSRGACGQVQAFNRGSAEEQGNHGRQRTYKDVATHSPGGVGYTRSEGGRQKGAAGGPGCATCGWPWVDPGFPHTEVGLREQIPSSAAAREPHAPARAREPDAPGTCSASCCDSFGCPSLSMVSSSSGLQWNWNGYVLNLSFDFSKLFSSVLQHSLPVALGSMGQHGGSHGEPPRVGSMAREECPDARKDVQKSTAAQVVTQGPTVSGGDEFQAGLGGSHNPVNETINCSAAPRPFFNSKDIPTTCVGGSHDPVNAGLENEAAKCSNPLGIYSKSEDGDDFIAGETPGDHDYGVDDVSLAEEESSVYEDTEGEGLLQKYYEDRSFDSETPSVELENTRHDEIVPCTPQEDSTILSRPHQDVIEQESQQATREPSSPRNKDAEDLGNKRHISTQKMLDRMGIKMLNHLGKTVNADEALTSLSPTALSRLRKGLRELRNLHSGVNYEGRGLKKGLN